MPARGRRSAKPFTRRRSAAAFRLRPPVPRMNLFPEPRPGGRSGGEAGAARGCSAPAPSRRTAGFAGVWVWMPVPALSGTSGVSQPVPAPRFADTFSPTSFYRRPFIGVLLPKAFFGGPSRRHGLPTPFCRRSFFGGPSLRGGAAFFVPDGTVRSVPSPLCPLSALSPLRSVPFPSLPCPVPVPALPRPFPVPAPSLSRPCPVPVPVPVPFLSRSCPVPVPVPSLSLSLSRSCPLSAPSPLRSVPFPSRSCPRPLFWRGAASSLFFGPRVEKPEKLFRFVISK